MSRHAFLIEDYRKMGFVIVPAIAIAEADHFYENLARLIRSKNPGKRFVDDVATCHTMMRKLIEHRPDILHTIYESLKNSSAIGKIVNHSSILSIAALLLELDYGANLYLSHHTCRIREPGDSDVNHRWHQESFYSVYGSSQVNLWMPLVHQSTASMGTISVLEQSHQDGELPHRLELKPDGKDQFFIPEESFDVTEYKEVHIELNPGDALFFHPLLIHRGNPNKSNLIRYCLTAAFVDPTDTSFRLTASEEQKDFHRQRCDNPNVS